jgi:N12 class adenine-specific DNA methylase
MALDDALGDGNAALRDSLLRQYQQDAPDFSDDAGVLTERLARKLTPIAPSPPVPTVDFSSPAEAPEAPEKAPDLAKYGTPVDPEPEPSTDDLSSFGTPVPPPAAPPLGVGGQIMAGAKGLLRAPLEQAGSSVQGLAALSPTKPVAPEGTALIDQLANAGTMSASERAKLMGQTMRTIGDRGLQMDFNAALQRIARGGDAQAESDQLRAKFSAQNAEAAKPIQEQAKYQTGTTIKQAADAIPMTDQEKTSAGGQIGSGVGAAATYLAAGALAGPEAAIALGAAGMGTSTAGATFEAAKAKGASDDDAAKAAGWGGAIGAALGTLPLGTVLRPITAVSAKLGSSGAAILAQHAIEGGAAFATVGEAQEYLLTKVAQQYYDKDAGYSPDAKRIIANLITGGVLGAAGHFIPKPKPSDISSPDDIADFIRRAGEARQRTLPAAEPIDGEVMPDNRGLPGPDTGRAPPPDEPPPAPPGTGEAATPPKTDHETLLDAGFSEQEIADMSPRARASRLAEATESNDTTETAGTATASSPDKVAEEPSATGKRDAPVVAKTVDDVLKASEIVKEPTPAQAVAGNYQHGHLELPHLDLAGKNGISIETGVGQIRRGTDPDGKPWEVRMPVAYGKIKGTVGADGDHLDVFIGPKPTSPHVFMIDQRDPSNDSFDEHKIMVGFEHPEAAVRAYRDSYADDATPRMGAVTALGPDEFKNWLATGDHTQRFSQPGPNEIAQAEPAAAAPAKAPAKPRAANTEPMTLMQFIASKGGIEPHPELKALDLAGDHRVQIPGRKGFFGVVRPTGMKLDDMREAAEEAGYLRGSEHATTTTRDLLDAIDEEFNRGNAKKAEGEESTPTKRERKADEESSAHARQVAIDDHRADVDKDEDYKHLAEDVKTRAAAIMADENLPLDDAVEQAAMRMVSEDADYGITPQLMSDTYGKDVSDAIQAKPAPRNGVVTERQGEGERDAGAKEEAQSHGDRVPDTGAQGREEPEEVTAAHHEAIEDALGPMADKVKPVDIARAAELLAEYPEMPPGIAFQYAVIENAVNQGDLTVAQAEEAYGPEVKEILGSGSEGAHSSEPRADEGRAESQQERSGAGSQARVVPSSSQTGEDAEDTGAVDREDDQQSDTGRADADAERETAGSAEPETAAGEGSAEAGLDDDDDRSEADRKFYDSFMDPQASFEGAQEDTIQHYAKGLGIFPEGRSRHQLVSALIEKGARGYQGGDIIAIPRSPAGAVDALKNIDPKKLPDDLFEKFKQSLAAHVDQIQPRAMKFETEPNGDTWMWKLRNKRGGQYLDLTAYSDVVYISGASSPTESGLSYGMSDIPNPVLQGFIKEFIRANPPPAPGKEDASRKMEAALDKIEEAVEAGDRDGVLAAGRAARKVLAQTPADVKATEPEYWKQFDAQIRQMVKPGYVTAQQQHRNEIAEAPTWAEVLHKLPMHADGRTHDTDLAFKLMAGITGGPLNKQKYDNLTGEQRHDLMRMVSDPFHNPAAKPQSTIPGTEAIGDGELAQRKSDQPLKPTAAQQPADDGLFGDGHKQTDLLDLKPAQEANDGISSSVSGRDAGSEPEDVPSLEEGRGAGAVRPVEGERGAPDVSGTDEGRSEGSGRPADLASSEGSGGGSESDDVRVSGRHADTEAGRSERADQRAAGRVKGENFHIDPGGLDEDRGPKRKAEDNLNAITLSNIIEKLDRPATLEEQQKLARYVGWGGLKNAFPDADGEFGKGFEVIGARLKSELTPEEYDTARRSIQYAHYTSEDIINGMWKAARQLGFEGGSVFEPGMGVGNFPGLMPPDVAEKSTYQGIELDHVSARIASLLYPKWGIRRDDFTRMPLPENAFDLAIGNPPFADIAIHSDSKYAKHSFLLHDYFFAKSLDGVRPGGLLMFVTSAGTMNKIDPSARNYLADRAEFIGAIRLPGNAFKKNAGTEVTTDIVVLRKLMPGETAADRSWTETAEVSLPGPDGKPVKGQISRYFAEHPEMVLGKGDFADKLYEGRYSVKAWDNFDLKDALAVAVAKLPRNVMKSPETPTERAEVDFDHTEKKQGSYYVDKDGSLRQIQSGAGVAVARRGKGIEGGKSAEQIERIRGLIPIRDALRETYAADLNDDRDAGDKARKKLNVTYDAFVGKYGPINKAEIQLRRPSVVQQESARAEAREEARYSGLDFNEGTFDATKLLDANRPMAEIARARKEAREAAATAGIKFDEGSFDPEDMKDNIIDKRPNIEPFMDDQEAYRLRAIEHYDDASGKASKGLVFSQNVITRETPPKINSINDAALYVLNQRGRLDLDAIGALADKSKSETIEALGDRIYRVPGTKDTWETKEAYLSGNVRKKLALAKAEAARDPLLRRNVEALEAAQPAPLAPAQIYAGLGMPWIPEKIVEQFAKEELGLTTFRAKYIPVLAQWTVSGDTDSVASITTFGTSRRNATALMSDALNHITPKIYDEADDKRILNVTATQDAQDKLTTIKEKFKGWVFADDARADPLAAYYNENYNNLVVRQYDGSYLTTPGIASGWKWRPHQTRVISRIIQEGNTYMAHAVGAGKTSAMIGSGMEMRRLGLVKKPMYAIPNHMLAQFTKEFYEQYPTARIAVADDRNFHAERRKQFMANVALDDLDAVIITHTNFGMIPVSDEFADEMIGVELDRYRNALAEMPSGQDSRITRSRIEKQIERLEQRLSGKSNRRRDNVFNFDEMGVDFLFVDEAQEFRKLDFSTQMSNLKGITPEGSGKAWDLYVKTKLLEKRNPGRNLVLASGTPVTNTMAELYTVSRYLQPGELAERQLSAFDAWAGAFGEEVSELEQDAAGGYKPVARFAKFINVAELSAMVRQVMDVVTSRQLEQYVTRPKIKGGKRSMNLAEKSPALIEYQDGLAARMVAIKNRGGKPKPGDDIMLTVIGDGRHAAIDIRLVGGDVDPDYPTKLELLIDNVFNTMKATARTKFYKPREGGYDMSAPVDVGPATQMIFSNLGISAKRGLPVHDYIRAELVRRGIPRDKIALISEYKTHIAKQKLFNDMNSGKVLLMIGSTAKMGTGVNAQRRLAAIHNLDPLWYPSDDEQRNGRGLRQGNWNPEIEINDYSTKGTYDSTMWGLMEKKARFIQGFFEGDPSMREMDDLGEASQYAQAKAMTTNDPRLMRLTELKQDLERSERRKSAFESERYALKRRQAEARSTLDYYGAREVNIQQDIKQRKDLSGDNFVGTVGKSTYDKRVDFGEALLTQLDKVTTTANIGRHLTIGEISGFPLRAHVRQILTENKGAAGNDLMLKRTGDAETTVHGTSALGMARSIESILSGFDADLAYAQDRVATAEKFLRESEGKEKARFQGEPEIDALASQVRDLEAQLAKKDEPATSTELPPPSPEALAQVMPLTERGAAKAAELERLLTEAVRKMVPNIQIKFHTGRIDHIDQGGWGDVAAKYKGVVGLYRPAKQLIELSLESGNPVSTAFHEAYHAIEHLLQTARERTLMAKETPRLRRAIDNGLIGFDKATIEGMAGYEVRAVAFELYRHQREKFGKAQNLHVGVRRWYHRLTDMTNRIRNGVNGLGFQTAEDIFAKAFEGGFADRTPPLLGTPFPQQEDALASVQNPFNGPLRDSVGAAIDERLANTKQKLIEGYQNLNRPVQNLETIIEARLAGELPDSQAFYQKKRLFPGKVAAEANDFNKNLLDPMIDLLKANKIDKDQAGDILYALHAPERNREMDKINMDSMFGAPDMVLGRGSGMSNDTAQEILNRYDPAVVRAIDQRADAIRDYINNLMVNSGLESATTVAGWRQTYDHYAPLSGWEDAPEEAPPGRSPKFNVRGPEVRSAFGRKSKADNPLANLIDQAYRTIERAKKNEYLQTVDNALHELDPDDQKNFVRFDRGRPKKELDKRTGLVRTVDDSNFRSEPGAVAFKRGGNVHYLLFDNSQLADAIKRMHADGLGMLQFVINIQNKLKASWTHYSPEFLLRHFLFRYPIEGTLNSFEQKESGDHSVGRYIADSTPFLGNASKAIFASNKGVTHDNAAIAELQRYWDEMRRAGGAMMFRQMRDTSLVREHMESKLNSLTNSTWSDAKAKWQAGVEAMDTVTNALDNALRLAAYAAARKQGKTPEQAAIVARDATVDFQQSGRWKNIMSLFAPFSGVAINTGARMTSAVARSRIMRMVFGSSVLAGFLSGMFNYLVGGNDKDGIPFADKMAWWEKSLTFTLLNPFGIDKDAKDRPQPIHIPMPYNWAFPLMIGQAAAAMVFTKDPHGVRKALGAVLKSGLEALTPFGAEDNLVAQISPELTRPLVHAYTNENWNGIPIHKDPAFQRGPRSESGRVNTGDGWKWAAKGINEVTGGDRKHSGALDVYPEDLREVFSYYSGLDTAMRFGRNVTGFVANAAEGTPDKEPSRIPFARVVRGTDYDQADKSRRFERDRESKQPWTR